MVYEEEGQEDAENSMKVLLSRRVDWSGTGTVWGHIGYVFAIISETMNGSWETSCDWKRRGRAVPLSESAWVKYWTPKRFEQFWGKVCEERLPNSRHGV